jgi:ABC-type transporter Mla MlaB component
MIRITLPPIMDRSAVTGCLEQLRGAFTKAEGVEISCEQVEQIGQAGLQLLASAVRTSADSGTSLAFTGGGGAVEASTRLAGMSGIIFGSPGGAA